MIIPLVYSWSEIAVTLSGEPPGTKVRIEKHLVEHPSDAGLRPAVGLPVGQTADFRMRLADCRGLHVQDFGTHYEAHIDQTDPACDVVRHLAQDAPGTFVIGSAILGGLVGLVLGRSFEAFAAGLLVGAGVGGVSAAASNPGGVERSAPPGTACRDP